MSVPETATGKVVETFTAVAAQAAAIGAVLYYYGYARTQSYYQTFGIDMSLVAMSAPDLMLRSLNTAVLPLILLLVSVVVARVVIASQETAPESRDRMATWFVIAAGAGMLVVVVGGILAGNDDPLGRVLAAAGTTTACAAVAGALFMRISGEPPAKDCAPPWYVRRRSEVRAAMQALLLVALAGFLVTIGWLAAFNGRQEAGKFANEVVKEPRITVRSDVDLGIPGGSGNAAENRYGFVYDNLRLIVHAHGSYFLMPAHWTCDPPVYVVRDDDHVRIDINGGAPNSSPVPPSIRAEPHCS